MDIENKTNSANVIRRTMGDSTFTKYVEKFILYNIKTKKFLCVNLDDKKFSYFWGENKKNAFLFSEKLDLLRFCIEDSDIDQDSDDLIIVPFSESNEGKKVKEELTKTNPHNYEETTYALIGYIRRSDKFFLAMRSELIYENTDIVECRYHQEEIEDNKELNLDDYSFMRHDGCIIRRSFISVDPELDNYGIMANSKIMKSIKVQKKYCKLYMMPVKVNVKIDLKTKTRFVKRSAVLKENDLYSIDIGEE